MSCRGEREHDPCTARARRARIVHAGREAGLRSILRVPRDASGRRALNDVLET
jgi:hypothetical protein